MKRKLKNIKAEFPALRGEVSYLDNAATTQKPEAVIKALQKYYKNFNGNADRGLYFFSLKSSELIEETRKILADFLNCEKEEIIFTKSATEGFNFLAYSLEKEISNKDEIISTEIEHHSNFVPWQQLALRKNAIFKVVKINKKTYELDNLEKNISPNTKVFAFTLMSNVTGKILNAREIISKIRKINKKTLIVLDVTQAIPHMPLDLKKIGADFVSFSSHKFYGPFGVGVLYGKKHLLERISPFLFGGGMVKDVTNFHSFWQDIPKKFEAGTQNAAEIYAFGEALKFFRSFDFSELISYEKSLLNYALQELKKIKGVKIIGHSDESYGPIISFLIEGIHPHDLAEFCAMENVCVRAGTHCAKPLMRRLNLSGTLRASFSFYNEKKDIDKMTFCLFKAMKKIHGRNIQQLFVREL